MSHLNDELQEKYGTYYYFLRFLFVINETVEFYIDNCTEDFRMLARRATLESLDQPDWELNTQCVNIVKDVNDAYL